MMKKLMINFLKLFNYKLGRVIYPTLNSCLPYSPIYKHKLILKIKEKCQINTFIATGTYLGNLIYSMKEKFSELYLIELSKELYENAVLKFEKDPHIKVIHGDSSIELKKLIPKLESDSVFWFDGHFSGGITAQGQLDTHIKKELLIIFSIIIEGFKHLIKINDARLFLNKINNTGYLRIETIRKMVNDNIPSYTVEVVDDVIFIAY